MTTEPRPWLQRGYCRAVSLLLATPLTLIFLIHPAAMLTADGHYNHRLIMLSMLGISSGFSHGVGFDPISRLSRPKPPRPPVDAGRGPDAGAVVRHRRVGKEQIPQLVGRCLLNRFGCDHAAGVGRLQRTAFPQCTCADRAAQLQVGRIFQGGGAHPLGPELLQQQDRIIRTFPEVESVFGKAGRALTATDPAPLEMLETIINLKREDQWREGMTTDRLIADIGKLVREP